MYYAELDGKDKLERPLVEAMAQFEKEALDLERAVSDVAIEVYLYMKLSAKYSIILLMRSSVLINYYMFPFSDKGN